MGISHCHSFPFGEKNPRSADPHEPPLIDPKRPGAEEPPARATGQRYHQLVDLKIDQPTNRVGIKCIKLL